MKYSTTAPEVPNVDIPHIGPNDTMNHIVLKKIEQCLLEHLRALPSNRGGGQDGHVKVMADGDDAYYNRLTNTAPPFVVPVHPGNQPNIPANATQHVIAEAHRVHNQQLHDHLTHENIHRSCKNGVLNNVDESHYYDLWDDDTGFSKVRFHELWAHFRSEHSTPTREALEANKMEHNKPHDLMETVKTTLMKKKKCQNFAKGTRAAITDDNLIQDTLTAFARTEDKHFNKKVGEFENRDVAEQTWKNLKKDMEAAEKQRLADPETSKEKGCANAAKEETAPEKEPQPDPGVVKIGKRKCGYCFTHGLSRNSKHTSLTCKFPCEEHKKEATLDNMMGGTRMICVPAGYKCLVP